MNTLLHVNKLKASVDETAILRGIDLKINAGEVHAIMGPNGSGKSTLAGVLSGKECYEVTGGSVSFDGKDLLDMAIDERSREGLFLAFQYPVELPGVNTMVFLRTALNAARKHRGQEELSGKAFRETMESRLAAVKMNPELVKRAVNEGFSGGEKKKNEVLQMATLQPKLAILDETDSGLDIDALQTVADGVNALRSADRGFLIITHYQRLLEYIEPDYVHVLAEGKIVRSGDKSLALELEEKGYSWLS